MEFGRLLTVGAAASFMAWSQGTRFVNAWKEKSPGCASRRLSEVK